MKYERIRNLLEYKDLTQTQIATLLHITQRTYSRYENDERAIPIEVLAQLADIHKTSIDYLIGRTDIKKPYLTSKKKHNKWILSKNHMLCFFFEMSINYLMDMYESIYHT